MRVVRINTTAWEEEDFFIMTTLSNEEIIETITPLVNEERNGGNEYDNDDLVAELVMKHPLDMVEMYNEIETLVI